MLELKGYENINVIQHDTINGCVPAGIEWLLRFYGFDVGDSKQFQAKYTVIKDGINLNTFSSVSKCVNKDFPNIQFKVREFQTGEEKFVFIEQLVESQIPVLISIITAVSPSDNIYHTVPVTKVDDSHIWITNLTEPIEDTVYQKADLIKRHNNYSGGNDILYIERSTFAK